jgi:ATP-dependent Clp protease protease subunit
MENPMTTPEEITKTFLANRQLRLTGDIYEKAKELIIPQLQYLNGLSVEPITLYIDSTGGGDKSGFAIADAIACSRAPIRAIVECNAYSVAFDILLRCTRRIAYPHAHIMFHGSTIKLRIDAKGLRKKLRYEMRLHEREIAFIAKRSGQSERKIEKWSRQERKFNAQEALKRGLIDEIAEPVAH